MPRSTARPTFPPEPPTQSLAPALPAQPVRPARALIGWMVPDAARNVLVGQRADGTTPMEVVAQARDARDAVARRKPGINQDGVITELPAELNPYIAGLQAHPGMAPYFAEGWSPVMADLRRVCVYQPHVLTDDAERRVASVAEDDLLDIARVTMPIPEPVNIPAHYDFVQKAWMVASRNPNLRVTQNFAAGAQPGIVGAGFGFAVAVLPSVVQVVAFRGRLLLRDGYHRAYGLLRRGITTVPVLHREFSAIEEVNIQPGMLPQEACLGDRPATVADYLDDEVSADVQVPAAQKLVIIKAIELNLPG